MRPRERGVWDEPEKKQRQPVKKAARVKAARILPKHLPALAAAVCCVAAGTVAVVRENGNVSAVMSHLTAGFEYDETLGRLQFVSNILPQSAMVFLAGGNETAEVVEPTNAEIVHVWSEAEPWLEFACSGDVVSCQDGEVMTVVRNRKDEYTVRVLHSSGYESIYSGLTSVNLKECDAVSAGQIVGTAGGNAAFELRRDGLSVQPVFAGL